MRVGTAAQKPAGYGGRNRHGRWLAPMDHRLKIILPEFCEVVEIRSVMITGSRPRRRAVLPDAAVELFYEVVAEQMGKLLVERRMTLTEVAEGAGISRSMASLVMRGKRNP